MNYLISFFVLLLTFFSYGQEYPKTSVIDKDTVLIFSQEQAKKIAQWNEERKYCIENEELLELLIQEKDTIIKHLSKQVEDFTIVEHRYNDIIKEKDDLQEIYEQENKIIHKEVKRQKRHKWIAIFSGIALGVIAIVV
jgi:DNA repair exonuclease SbcCD ATPase subunit